MWTAVVVTCPRQSWCAALQQVFGSQPDGFQKPGAQTCITSLCTKFCRLEVLLKIQFLYFGHFFEVIKATE